MARLLRIFIKKICRILSIALSYSIKKSYGLFLLYSLIMLNYIDYFSDVKTLHFQDKFPLDLMYYPLSIRRWVQFVNILLRILHLCC